ncbi:MAG: YcnI family protein [Rhodospirillaceae bacterium]|nr:YcnI family protein [Rhodospirillaceae bacterium]
MRFRSVVAAVIGAAGLGLAAGPEASAHVLVENMKGRAGYNEMFTLIVPHGCGSSPTTELRMKVPPELSQVIPEAPAGWNVQVLKRKVDKPVMRSGRPVTEVVDEIVWSGNSLPSEHLGLFRFMAGVPNTPDKVLYFKTIQKCAEGESRWVDTVPDTEEIWRVWLKDYPSPYAVVIAPDAPQLGVDMKTLAKADAEMKAKAKPQ